MASRKDIEHREEMDCDVEVVYSYAIRVDREISWRFRALGDLG
jgi:hypothetical protein